MKKPAFLSGLLRNYSFFEHQIHRFNARTPDILIVIRLIQIILFGSKFDEKLRQLADANKASLLFDLK